MLSPWFDNTSKNTFLLIYFEICESLQLPKHQKLHNVLPDDNIKYFLNLGCKFCQFRFKNIKKYSHMSLKMLGRKWAIFNLTKSF